ncbi:two pore domain potassium channel family protein, partial [bacterium]|nr:two pore domain potassium channel family protein [bacterium]
MQKERRIITTVIAFSFLLCTGTVGYRFIEGNKWSYFDGFFMTIITLATVGYNETHPLSDKGRVFTVAL